MNIPNSKRRAKRVRSSIRADSKYPRLSVYRSNAHIWAQLIDDSTGKTIVAASDAKLKTGTKIERAAKVGTEIAALILKKDIKQVVFDRGGYRFHGRVKALAEAARKAGLTI